MQQCAGVHDTLFKKLETAAALEEARKAELFLMATRRAQAAGWLPEPVRFLDGARTADDQEALDAT